MNVAFISRLHDPDASMKAADQSPRARSSLSKPPLRCQSLPLEEECL